MPIINDIIDGYQLHRQKGHHITPLSPLDYPFIQYSLGGTDSLSPLSLSQAAKSSNTQPSQAKFESPYPNRVLPEGKQYRVILPEKRDTWHPFVSNHRKGSHQLPLAGSK